ncbi:UPF0450 protein C17orf58 homolog [Spea bombifrons]|uniref:UPF0450 protein C17orf58 homolog n=1 Tax=Spea bombifrons TaxID=233779 RepID=UPI00234BF590|nr:UPF0450 protein C17orf58 homolog [Spea bombifrons]
MLAGGMRLATLLLDSAGLYKTKRLYIAPDGFFFRVNILSVDSPKCPKSCPEFKLGSRYIVMGRIYPKRTELPADARQLLGGRLRAGDGLVGCGSYVRSFNRKRERKVLAAARAKCK